MSHFYFLVVKVVNKTSGVELTAPRGEGEGGYPMKSTMLINCIDHVRNMSSIHMEGQTSERAAGCNGRLSCGNFVALISSQS